MKKQVFLIAVGVILLDIITKLWAQNLLENKTIPLLGKFFQLELVYNDGIAFGMNLISPLFLKFFTILLILIGIWYIIRSKNITKYESWSYGLILWWAIGNGIERVFFGKVTDFFSMQYFSVFNVADIAITLWALLFLYTAFFTTNTK